MKQKRLLNAFLLAALVCFMAVAAVACGGSKLFTVTVVGGTGGGSYEQNAECTLTADVGEHEKFVRWTVDGEEVSTSNPYTFTVEKDVTVTAVKEPLASYTVTVVGGTGGGTYYAGENCTVSASLGENEIFVEWQKNGVKCSGENPYTFTVTGNVTLNAVLKKHVDVGAFARRWVGAEGELDLVEGTLTDVKNFEVSAVSGEGAQTEITCVAGGSEYLLKLNDEGALEMRLKNDESAPVYATFMAESNEFGGAWTENGYTYYVFSTVADENGYFAWDMFTSAGESLYGTCTAVTRFTFDESGEPSVTFFLEDEYLEFSFDEDGKLFYEDYWYGDKTVLEPFAGVFTGSYLNEKGDKFALDTENGKIGVNGTEAEYRLDAGANGGGLQFTVGESEYSLVYMLDGVYGYEDGVRSLYAPYVAIADVLVGEWSNSKGNSVRVEENGKLFFKNSNCLVTEIVSDGVVCYRFVSGSYTYTVCPVAGAEGVFRMETRDASANGYFFLDSLKQSFVKDYTNSLEVLSVNEQFKAVFLDDNGEETSYDTVFTYLPDLNCVALNINGFYMVRVEEEGVYWLIGNYNGSLTIISTYFEASLIPELEEAFLAGLSESAEEADFYTTGTSSPKTVSFDFENGKVNYNGKAYDYMWNYEINALGSAYVTLVFTDMESENDRDYYYWSARMYDLGLQLSVYHIANGQETDPVYEYYISHAAFGELLGKTFVFRGEVYDETVTIDANGRFFISGTNKTETDEAVVLTEYGYTLARYSENGKAVIRLGFVEKVLEIYVYIDGCSASITAITYTREDLLPFLGTYYNGGDTVAFTDGARIALNGETATVTSLETKGETVVVAFTVGENKFSAVFAENSVSVTRGNETAVEYVKRVLTPKAFVGTYSLADKKIVVSAHADSLNEAISLVVKVDGTKQNDVALAFTAEGKQQLTFGGYILTLDGGTISMTDGTDEGTAASAAAWDYSRFVFDEVQTVYDPDDEEFYYDFSCVSKENGRAPIFYIDDTACMSYDVTFNEDGSATLDVATSFPKVSLRVTVASDGTMSFSFTPDDDEGGIPLPPPLPF